MFDKIQHIGYLTSDLEAAVAWFERSFGAVNAGGGPLSPSYAVPSGGRNAYLRFGQAEAEIIEPEDKSAVGSKVLDMHHVGYVVESMDQAAEQLRARGFAFGSDEPFVNVFGHQVFYLDAETTNGTLVHLTQLAPAASGAVGEGWMWSASSTRATSFGMRMPQSSGTCSGSPGRTWAAALRRGAGVTPLSTSGRCRSS